MQSDFLQIPPDTYRYYYQVQQILFKIPFCFWIWHKSDMKSFFLCNGNETQEIVKPSGEHDFCFQWFIGMVCTRKRGISDLCQISILLFFKPNYPLSASPAISPVSHTPVFLLPYLSAGSDKPPAVLPLYGWLPRWLHLSV